MSSRILPPSRFISLFSILFFPVLALFFSPHAKAYCPVPGIRANGEFFKSDIVFTGTVLSIRKKPDVGNDPSGWFYRVQVEQIFRGLDQKELTVYTEDSDIRFPLEKNSKYLLFVYRRHRRLEIDNCGNSALISDAAESLRRLRMLRNGKQRSEIEGSVAEETAGRDVSGIRVVIRSPSKVFTAITDKDGRFDFAAPPGRYQVDFTAREYYLNGDDRFWYNPHHFFLHFGECASLQLVSVRHLTK
jgi:hypothetical protein